MLSTAPAPRSTIPGRAAWVSSISVSELSTTSSVSRSSGNVWNTPLVPKPALLHKPAIGSPRSRSASWRRASASDRSSGCTSTSTEYSARSSPASSSIRSLRRATSSSGYPRLASPLASSVPMPDEAPVMTTVAWLVGFGSLMIASPMDSAGGRHESFASMVEIGCAAVRLIAFCRGRVCEHSEGPVTNPIHHRRIDCVGEGSELPERRAGPPGALHDRVGDHTGGLVRRERRELVVHLGGADHRRPDQRHVHSGEFDVVADHLGLQRVAEAVQSGLAGDVGTEPRRPGLHTDRGHVDDLPESTFTHAWNEFENQLHRAEVVQLHGALIVVD